jgi:hypothetical protein
MSPLLSPPAPASARSTSKRCAGLRHGPARHHQPAQRDPVHFHARRRSHAAQPAGPQVFPHFADGGGFTTALALVNPADLPLSGTLEFFSSTGGPHARGPPGRRTRTTTRYLIPQRRLDLRIGRPPRNPRRLGPPHSRRRPGRALRGGRLPAWAEWRRGQRVRGPALGADAPARVFIDRTAGRDTGVALANPSNIPVNVTLRALRLDGVTPVSPARVLTLPARGHTAAVSGDLVGELPDGLYGRALHRSAHPDCRPRPPVPGQRAQRTDHDDAARCRSDAPGALAGHLPAYRRRRGVPDADCCCSPRPPRR